MEFAVPADHRVKLKECEKRDKYLARELKRNMEHESDDYINCNWCSWHSNQKMGTMSGGLGKNGTGGDCLNCSIVDFGQNTEKSPGDLKILPFSQTPAEKHQLTLMWRTLNEKNNNHDTDLVIIDNNKKNLPYNGFCRFRWPQSEKEERSKKRDEYLDLARERRKLGKMRVTMRLIAICALGKVSKGMERDWKGWK